jgi:hypothetical protein
MRVIKKPSLELWDQVVSRSEYATFFHTCTWAQIVVETYPQFHIATKSFVLDDGAIAIVPMVATTERRIERSRTLQGRIWRAKDALLQFCMAG